jgi:hypothetical protein
VAKLRKTRDGISFLLLMFEFNSKKHTRFVPLCVPIPGDIWPKVLGDFLELFHSEVVGKVAYNHLSFHMSILVAHLAGNPKKPRVKNR